MKSRWIFLAAAAALYGCGSRTTQTTTQTETTSTSLKAEERDTQLCGGYTSQRPLRTDEEQLFDVLTLEVDSAVYTAKSVATQVVAGTNYKYICTAKPKSGGKPYLVELVIYKPLPNSGKLPEITQIERIEE